MSNKNSNEELQSRREFFKKAILATICVAFAFSPIPMGATNYGQEERIVSAIYLSTDDLKSMLIKVSGDYVVAYCSGRDYQGHQIWNDIQPAKISRNQGFRGTSNEVWNDEIYRCQYTARIGGIIVYF